MNVLTISGITKHYKRVTALKNVSFSVPEGAVYGILGPNGSGKTTLLGIVTGVLRVSGGTYQFFDGARPLHELRKEMGVLLETPNFYPYLSAYQNLLIVARIKGCDPAGIPDVLQRVDLLARQHDMFRTYSLGMKQRLAIASALLGNPRIVILDEPTNGLDPEGISEIRRIIQQLAAEGKTILLASHLLDEVEKVCTHVAILRKGVLLAEGEIHEALSRGEKAASEVTTMELEADDPEQLARVVKGLAGVTEVQLSGRVAMLSCRAGTLTPQEVNRYCFDNGIVLGRLATKPKGLESKFLELTK
ncbi:MAG: ABC transporter ATP-binding protein [Odoribacteraceae bacterium]|jgi:ABC-2 type transport system ATP-binding protein|nr:ABC transporter ATP-binding protein [Odoribacteraceae bacterium]